MTAALPKHIEAASPHVMNTYGRLPIALDHGQGCRVWDVNGKAYLDALGGIAVNTLGHNHPKLVPALQEQISKLIHSSNYYHVPLQEALAAKLVELSGLENVFSAPPAWKPTRPRSSSRASLATTKALSARKSWSTKKPSMAAASPP
jgi:acetylornithine/succinyldiaminopimelate/putrescine aminotransferase